MERALSFTHHPHDLPRLRAHLHTIAQQDTWTFRGVAAHISVERAHVPHLGPVRDTLLAAAAEHLPLTLRHNLTVPV